MGAIATLIAFGLVFLRASTFAVPSTDKQPVENPGYIKNQLDIILETIGEIKTQLDGMNETTEEIKKEIDGMHETTEVIKSQMESMHETTEEIKTQMDGIHETTEEIKTQLNGMHETTEEIKKEMDGMHETTGEIKTQMDGMYESTEEIKKEMDGMYETTGEIKTQMDGIYKSSEKSKTQADGMQSEINLLHQEFRRRTAFALSNCPPGFVYLPESESCYQVVSNARRNFTAASQNCQDLYNGAHLAVITSECENKAVEGLMRSAISNNPNISCQIPDWIPGGHRFWLGGQRFNVNDCKSEFVWKLPGNSMLPMNYSHWLLGEPSCVSGSGEACLHVWPDRQYLWNDVSCGLQVCAVCEYNPPLQHSCL